MANLANVAATLHEHLCTDPRHGYTQGNGRWGDGEGVCGVEVDGKVYEVEQGDRDCSSSVIECWQVALQGTPYEGALDGATYTGNMRSVFVASGLFEWKPMSFIAQRGDIYLNEGQHTAMCQSAVPDMLSEFCINEKGTIVGGAVGDQTGRESHVRGYYDFSWDGILHYNGKADGTAPEPAPSVIPDLRYRASVDAAGKRWLPEMVNHYDPSGSGDDYAGTGREPIRWLAIDMPGWYQVRTKSGWLGKIRKYDVGDLNDGCAGNGEPITGVRCYYETQAPDSTGWLAIEYAVANLGLAFMPTMRDLTDTGGSDDDYAGNGGQIAKFRARLVRV